MVVSSSEEEEMIFGAHVVVYGKNAAADRPFFRDILGFKSVNAGQLANLRPAADRSRVSSF